MTRNERRDEVREILALDTDELVKRSNGQLVLFPTLDEVYDYLAEEMVNEFEKAAKGDKIVSFIMPVGPTQPYRLMAEKINYRQLNLRNVRFFFMDEYVDDEKDELIPETSPLSFRGQIGSLLFNRIRPDLIMPKDQIIFPTPENIKDLPKMIEDAGGIEVCYGGIGIHGHVAFNEPGPGVAESNPRILENNFNILYGHNMKNGSMFANVCRFKDKSYYDSHPYGWVYTSDAVYRLDFFSVAVTDWYDEIYNGFRSLDEWTPHLKEISRIYEEVGLTEQDRLVLLSTCSYEFDNARTVLTGRLVEMEGDVNE